MEGEKSRESKIESDVRKGSVEGESGRGEDPADEDAEHQQVQPEELGRPRVGENDSNYSKKKRQQPQAQNKVRVNWLIELLYTRGETEECLRLVESQLQACKGLCEFPLYIKGLIFRQQGKVQQALELFQAATLLNPMSQENLKQVGKSLFLLGKHKAALDVLDEAAIQTETEDWEIHHNKGLCLMYLKDYAAALDAFRDANAIQRHECTFIEMGKVLCAQEKYQDAIQVYLEALEFSPESPELLTTVGLLYLRTSESFKAFDYLGNSLTHDPKNPKTILAAGSVIQDHSDMDVALVKYRIAVVKTPNSAQLWNNIGMCFFGKQKFVAAVACLKRSLYLDPFQWITAYNLGLVHLRTGQFASAFHYLSMSINLRPDFASTYMYLAITLTRLEDEENAVAAYEKAIELDDSDAVCYLNYAAMLHNRGDVEHSKEQFDKYTKICSQLPSGDRKALMDSCISLHNSLMEIHKST